MGKLNLSILIDFYELTMANGYFKSGLKEKQVYFDMFFRKVPDDGGFAIMAGLEQLIEFIQNLEFDEEDIDYLRTKEIFDEDFLDYLKNFDFNCDIWAIPEGTPVFPNEPILTIKGSIIEAQLIETMTLLTINHQSLIATKANRIVRTAQSRDIIEYGSRRSQGYSAAIYGARASYIGGCVASSCTLAEKEFGVPVVGTMAHSWVQMFDSEEEAFRAYARVYPENCIFLVDTYNVLKSGVPNAIKVFKEELISKGFRPKGIRLDSGDITYLSKEARKMLDDAGFEDCKIIASNSLDEFIIRDLIVQGAKVDSFGVGEGLITAKSDPVFGGVYKLVAVEEDGEIVPKIKLSENISKITNPDLKEVWRLYDKDTGKAIADVLTKKNEVIDESSPYEIFDEKFTWKRKIVTNFTAKKLMTKIFEDGVCIYNSPTIDEIKEYCKQQIELLWDEVKRLENPHKYYVDLSKPLWDTKQFLLHKHNIKNT